MLQIGQYYSVLTAVHWNDKNIPKKQIKYAECQKKKTFFSSADTLLSKF